MDEFRGVEKWSSDFVVPDWYKSHMVNLVSKGKVRIELMVTGGQACYCNTWNKNLSWSVYSNQYSREGTQSAVGMCRFILPSKGTLNEGLIYRKQAIAMGISHVLSLRVSCSSVNRINHDGRVYFYRSWILPAYIIIND
ncbi:unnamed protein product [Vicia faba]|uniref:Uncharacterized protein n=1 Tax=Vicia faba TaxID=3906 RepID=A0AAV0ZZA2_VICFA|nr:unnamed protein product [Vicia faba]